MTVAEPGVTAAPTQTPPRRAIRPDRLTVWPTEGGYAIDVRWHGRECILRAVVVRRLLVEAGYDATPGNSQDGRLWELRVGPVPAEEIGHVIDTHIW